jgi:HK97 family phage portal protein
MTGTRDEPKPLPAGSELANLVDRPNQYQSFPELQAEMYTNFNLFGNAYIWFKRKAGQEFPVSFFNLRADRVIHLYDDNDLKGFLFVPVGMTPRDGVPLMIEDTMHVRLPNPADPFLGLGKGLSPIAPLARSADVDNAATEFLKLFFEQGAMPMGLLKTDQPIDDETASEAKERWLGAYGNWQQWIEPVVMGKGIEYQRLGANFDELDLEKLDARNTGRISAAFGVPLTLILSQPGLVQATYSNKETDHRMFISNVLVSELSMFGEEWRFFLRNKSGTQFAQYDMNGVPGFIDQMLRIENLAAAWTNGGATRAEYRKVLGLPIEESDNVFMISFTTQLIPAGGTPQIAPRTEVGANSAETVEDGEKGLTIMGFPVVLDDSMPDGIIRIANFNEYKDYQKFLAKQTNAQKLAIHNEINRVPIQFQDPALEQSQKAFRKDQREIMAIVSGGQKNAYEGKQTVDWTIINIAISAYLAGESKEQWRLKFDSVLAGAVTAQGNNLSNIFELPFVAQEFLEQDWFLSYRMVFVDPISSTSEREISALMQEAAANGWSVPQMQENLTILFEQWIDGTALETMEEMTEAQLERLWFATNRLPPWRSELIARTEMIRASNGTAFNLYTSWGVQEKEWFSTPDPRTRLTHQIGAAFGQDPVVVSIGEAFNIGGSPLMFPGDPGGPLEETAQCRCTVLPVMPG